MSNNNLTSPFSDYRSLGIGVLPLNKETKKPAVKWKKYQSELPSIEQCREWDKGNYNVGIVTGSISGLLAFDIDGDAGRESLKSLPDMPKTWKATTGRGEHHYFRLPAGQAFKSKIGALPGIDIKCEAGYVVAPPSIHSSGKSYKWEVFHDDMPEPAPVPGFILDLLKSKTEKSCESYQSGESFIPIEDIAFITEIESLKVEKSFEGSRNQTLNSAAYNVGKHMHFGIAEQPARDRLLQAALQVGLHEDEAIATINSGINAGKKKPVPFSPALNDWPVPLMGQDKMGDPYPIHVFPKVMRDAIEAHQAHVKQPIEIAALSALSALSLSAQGIADVVRGYDIKCPITLNMMLIADSGERKSTADKAFMGFVREVESQRQKQDYARLELYNAHKGDISSQQSDLKRQRTKLLGKSKGKDKEIDKLNAQIMELSNKLSSTEPIVTKMLFEDVTVEAMIPNIAKGWPSAGLISDEAAIFAGSYSMTNEKAVATFGSFNTMWDGKSYQRERVKAGSVRVAGRRLTVSLMMQYSVFCQILGTAAGQAVGTGFLARFLICYPKSTKGTRKFARASEEQKKHLKLFGEKLNILLSHNLNMEEKTLELKPRELPLSDEAEYVWIDYYNAIEKETGEGGKYGNVSDFSSKSAEQAARISALFQLFEDVNSTEISKENIARGCILAQFYLDEAKYLLERSKDEDALEMLEWLMTQKMPYNVGDISQFCLKRFRPKKVRDKLLKSLEEHNMIKIGKEDNKTVVFVNPKCLG